MSQVEQKNEWKKSINNNNWHQSDMVGPPISRSDQTNSQLNLKSKAQPTIIRSQQQRKPFWRFSPKEIFLFELLGF